MTSGRRRQDLTNTFWYFLGGVCGALITLLLVALVSSVLAVPLWPRSLRLGILGLLVALLLLHETSVIRLRLPERREQVPRDRVRSATPRSAIVFGFELGLGFRTYVTATAPYVLLVAIFLVVPSLGLLISAAVGFALGRSLVLLVRALLRRPIALTASAYRVLRTSALGLSSAAVAMAWLLSSHP